MSERDGVITITMTNTSLESSEDVEILLTKAGSAYEVCEAAVVTGKMNAHNTFEAPDVVKEEAFTAYSKSAEGIKVTLPACSVVSVRIKK